MRRQERTAAGAPLSPRAPAPTPPSETATVNVIINSLRGQARRINLFNGHCSLDEALRIMEVGELRPRQSELQLCLRVPVTTPKGTTKVMKILVDTGAQASLVSKQVLSEDEFSIATHPISLQAANNTQMVGGDLVVHLNLALSAYGLGSPTPSGEVRAHGHFYSAEMPWDMIIGFPFLYNNALGVLPHRKCLVLERQGSLECVAGLDTPRTGDYATAGLFYTAPPSWTPKGREARALEAQCKGILPHRGWIFEHPTPLRRLAGLRLLWAPEGAPTKYGKAAERRSTSTRPLLRQESSSPPSESTCPARASDPVSPDVPVGGDVVHTYPFDLALLTPHLEVLGAETPSLQAFSEQGPFPISEGPGAAGKGLHWAQPESKRLPQVAQWVLLHRVRAVVALSAEDGAPTEPWRQLLAPVTLNELLVPAGTLLSLSGEPLEKDLLLIMVDGALQESSGEDTAILGLTAHRLDPYYASIEPDNPRGALSCEEAYHIASRLAQSAPEGAMGKPTVCISALHWTRRSTKTRGWSPGDWRSEVDWHLARYEGDDPCEDLDPALALYTGLLCSPAAATAQCVPESRHGPRLQVPNPTRVVHSVVTVPAASKERAEQCEEVRRLKAEIEARFRDTSLSGVPVKDPPKRCEWGEARIHLTPGATPYRARAFKMEGERGEALKKIIEQFVERGWLEKSHSEWASPAFVVPKKKPGEWRLVVDFRHLNLHTRHDSYGIPLIQDILQRQAKRRIFSVLDLKHGYHQMPLAESDRHLTAMSTPLGIYQWRVMPMGVKNGNAQFQRLLDDVLEDLPCADPFVDDVLVGSEGETWSELVRNHAKDLTAVLQRFEEKQLMCAIDKVHLFVESVEFGGHVIGHGIRRPISGKLAALEKWDRPSNISELRAFLGFCNYYSDYVPHYADIARLLTAMLQVNRQDGKKGSKKKLEWTDQRTKAFHDLKAALLAPLALHLIDPDRPFVLRTDASDYAVGAVLEQVDDNGVHVPVAFWSRPLAPGQRRTWTPREKEAYAIVCALRKWGGHIGLQPVTVCTDHQSLQSWHKEHVDTPSGPAARRARWHETLAKFALEVVYVPGKDNTIADVLSRWAYPAGRALVDISMHGDAEETADAKAIIEEERACERSTEDTPLRCAVVRSVFARMAPIAAEESLMNQNWGPHYLKSIPEIRHLWEQCQGQGPWPKGCQVHQGKLIRDGRLVIPTPLLTGLVKQWHEHQLGHANPEKMWADLEHRFDHPDLRPIIYKVHKACQVCMAANPPNWRSPPYSSTPVPLHPMESISMDIFSMPEASDPCTGDIFDCIVLTVCRHSGWIVAVPALKDGLTAQKVALLLHRHWLTVFGVPKEVTTDRGPQFAGQWFRTMCGLQGIRHKESIAWHSRSNGRAEVAGNQLFSKYRKWAMEGRFNWISGLHECLRVYHDTPTPAGHSPHRILFGRDGPGRMIPFRVPGSAVDAEAFAQEQAKVAQEVHRALQEIHAAAQRAAEKAQKRGAMNTGLQYRVGEAVWVLRPRPLGTHRLASWWVPGVILQRLGEHSYDVQTSVGRQRACHIADLKPRPPDLAGNSVSFDYTPSPTDIRKEADCHDLSDTWEVGKIVGHRPSSTIPGGWEFRVRWKGHPPSKDTWEPPNQFLPNFNEPWVSYCKTKRLLPDLTVHLGPN